MSATFRANASSLNQQPVNAVVGDLRYYTRLAAKSPDENQKFRVTHWRFAFTRSRPQPQVVS